MPYKYSAIKLGDAFRSFTINGSPGEISGLSPINIFIGENNAGKSRFMRELAKHKHSTEFLSDSHNFDELKHAFDIFYAEFSEAWNEFTRTAADTHGIPGYGSIDVMQLKLDSYIPNSFNDDYFDQSKPNPGNFLRLIDSINDDRINVNSHRGDYRSALLRMKLALKEQYAEDFIKVLTRFSIDKIDFDKHYIPTIRSLNNFQEYQADRSLDIFEARVRKIYGFDDEAAVDVFTGQKIYERIKNMLLGDIDLRERMRKYEKFLSNKLFNGQDVVIIPKIDRDVVAVKIGSEERLIYELGDGIQSLIILTFPLFESEHGMFFIEEPELNMHPGMQRKFLEAIQANPQHQYYFTTHSNHILDLTIDYSNISIYAFNKEDSVHSVELITHGDKNILELIGARATSVFLANKSIWVEGITDRLYLKKYLELYLKNNPSLRPIPREDIDHIFIEYGGNNITHWSFLDSSDPTINTDRITANLMLVIDDDGDQKQDRKTALRTKLGKRYVKLDEREIENTISLQVLLDVIASYEPKTKQPTFDIDKIDTTILQTTLLGTFIHDEIFKEQAQAIGRKGGYRADSGTIKSKLDFCHRAIELMTYENMSEPSKKIAKRIYEFIIE